MTKAKLFIEPDRARIGGISVEEGDFAATHDRARDVLDRQLAVHEYIAGADYSIADIAIWPWYGLLARGEIYDDAGTFLDVASYRHVVRWAEQVGARAAVRRGRMVNRASGPLDQQLRERHDASDFDTRTQDKLEPV